MKLLRKSKATLALLIFDFFLPVCGYPQSIPTVPEQYRRLFFQYADQRSRFEKALNLIGKTNFPAGRSFALIAGVTLYPNFPPLDRSLTPAAADIKKLQDYLKEQEFFDELVVLKDGDMTLPNLNYFLENYFPERLAASPHSRFLFAYSGHGYSVKAGETTRGYLLTSSATSLTDPVNRLDLDVLRSMLGSVIDSAEKTLVLINSCHSGAFLGSRTFGESPFSPGEKGAHAIMASRSSQQSLHLEALGPGSVFFEEIFAALGGAADNAPADGVVTYHELDTYLHGEIPHATKGNQNPVEGDIMWPHRSVGEFFFLNRSRQISFGNATPWNPKDAVAFGVIAEDTLEKARAAYRAERYCETIEPLTQASEAGNHEAMNFLGYMYAMCTKGQGGADYQRAQKWWEKAAAAGNSAAMFNLGFLYLKGLIPKDGYLRVPDYQQAYKWYERAALAGRSEAMFALGQLYDSNGDYEQARQWYERSAVAGNAEAMNSLGSMFFWGKGVPQDKQQAQQWFQRAKAAGHKEAKKPEGFKFFYEWLPE